MAKFKFGDCNTVTVCVCASWTVINLNYQIRNSLKNFLLSLVIAWIPLTCSNLRLTWLFITKKWSLCQTSPRSWWMEDTLMLPVSLKKLLSLRAGSYNSIILYYRWEYHLSSPIPSSPSLSMLQSEKHVSAYNIIILGEGTCSCEQCYILITQKIGTHSDKQQ